jgi:hypothetical protein
VPVRAVIGDMHAAYGAALRELVGQRFSVTFSDPNAGVITAQRDEFDAETTENFAAKQRQIWESLTSDQQALAYRMGRADQLTRRITARRKMTVSVVISGGAGLVSPSVVTCADQQPGVMTCGNERGVRSPERSLVQSIAAAMESAR